MTGVRMANIGLQIVLKFGGKCGRCGFADYRALQIDHVNGRKDGFKHTNLVKILREIEQGSTEYQLLCANCNWIKKYEEHEHPYRTQGDP